MGSWEAESNRCTFAFHALCRDVTALSVDQCAGNGESQSCAAVFAVAGLVHTVEALEDEWKMFSGDACPFIADRTFYFVV